MTDARTKLPFLMIRWVDSNRTGREWVSIEGYGVVAPTCVSAGWLVHQDDDQITVCGNLSLVDESANSFVHSLTIPRRAITEMWEIGGMQW